jgi:chromosome segregation ATPase
LDSSAIQAETRIDQMVAQQQSQADGLEDIKKRVMALERKCSELEKENAALKLSGPVDDPTTEIPIKGATTTPPTNSTGRKNT